MRQLATNSYAGWDAGSVRNTPPFQLPTEDQLHSSTCRYIGGVLRCLVRDGKGVACG